MLHNTRGSPDHRLPKTPVHRLLRRTCFPLSAARDPHDMILMRRTRGEAGRHAGRGKDGEPCEDTPLVNTLPSALEDGMSTREAMQRAMSRARGRHSPYNGAIGTSGALCRAMLRDWAARPDLLRKRRRIPTHSLTSSSG